MVDSLLSQLCDNQWPTAFGPISNPSVCEVLYLVKYLGSFNYFTSHNIKNWFRNAITLPASQLNNPMSKPLMNLGQHSVVDQVTDFCDLSIFDGMASIYHAYHTIASNAISDKVTYDILVLYWMAYLKYYSSQIM